MKKCLLVVVSTVLVVILAVGCAGVTSPVTSPTPDSANASSPVTSAVPTPTPNQANDPLPATSAVPLPETTSAVEKSNFRVWISDEVNNIDHFEELWVTVTGIGVVKRGGGDNVTMVDDNFTEVPVPLHLLRDDNATMLWDGQLEDGDYVKVFLYIDDNITQWTLSDKADENATAEVKLPSGKLQISKPFTLNNNELPVDFVCDATVVKAGNKNVIGGKYILKPQLAASGIGQNIVPVQAKVKSNESNKPKPKQSNFQGTIEVIDDNSTWLMDLEGYTELLTVEISQAVIKGEPEEGLEAKVKGRLDGDTILASKVEIMLAD